MRETKDEIRDNQETTKTTETLREMSERMERVNKEMLALQGDLALEVGRNIKWQSMFEELGQAAVMIAGFVKKTYLTKVINIQELEAVYILAERIEKVLFSYQKRRDLVNMGKLKEEEVVDD